MIVGSHLWQLMPVVCRMSDKTEEVAALEALRDSSAELVKYLDAMNEKLTQLNQQNELSLRVLENWSSVITISKATATSSRNDVHSEILRKALENSYGAFLVTGVTKAWSVGPSTSEEMASGVRTNGFQSPLSRDQVTSWVLQPFMMSCFIAFVVMLLDRAKCISILVPTGILILIILCCWFICEARDPSTEKSKDSFSVLSVPRKMTRYCTICCKTSPGLDHHCTWLNTCIADNNYEAFFFLVIAATVETLLQAVVGILMATAWFDEVKLQLSSSWHTPILVLLWVHNAIILSLANSYCLLAGFHIYLVAIRSGTYDFILENGNEGICARMLKCKCLTYSKGRRRRTTRGEKRRSTSKTSPTPTSSKVVAAPRAARGDGPTAHDLVASASKQREVEQWKAEWLRKYGSDDSDKPASAMIQSKAMQTANMSDLKGVHEREHGNSVTNRRETSPDALQTQDEVQIEMGSGIKMSEGGSEDKGKDTPQHREDERSADCCVNPQPPQESPRGVQTEL